MLCPRCGKESHNVRVCAFCQTPYPTDVIDAKGSSRSARAAASMRAAGLGGNSRNVLAGVALVFGVATVVAGASVLLGRDAGYVVYRPLLIFNTAMGAAYAAAAVMIWRDAGRGRRAAAVILALNVAVLGFVGFLFRTGGAVAIDSVRAMAFRSAVWLVIFGVLVWTGRRQEQSP